MIRSHGTWRRHPQKRKEIPPTCPYPHSLVLFRRSVGQPLHLKLLHELLTHRPHARSLAVNVHGYRSEKARDLDAANDQKDRLWAVGFQPVGEEEGEDEAVEDVWQERVSGMLAECGVMVMGRTYFWKS